MFCNPSGRSTSFLLVLSCCFSAYFLFQCKKNTLSSSSTKAQSVDSYGVYDPTFSKTCRPILAARGQDKGQRDESGSARAALIETHQKLVTDYWLRINFHQTVQSLQELEKLGNQRSPGLLGNFGLKPEALVNKATEICRQRLQFLGYSPFEDVLALVSNSANQFSLPLIDFFDDQLDLEFGEEYRQIYHTRNLIRALKALDDFCTNQNEDFFIRQNVLITSAALQMLEKNQSNAKKWNLESYSSAEVESGYCANLLQTTASTVKPGLSPMTLADWALVDLNVLASTNEKTLDAKFKANRSLVEKAVLANHIFPHTEDFYLYILPHMNEVMEIKSVSQTQLGLSGNPFDLIKAILRRIPEVDGDGFVKNARRFLGLGFESENLDKTKSISGLVKRTELIVQLRKWVGDNQSNLLDLFDKYLAGFELSPQILDAIGNRFDRLDKIKMLMSDNTGLVEFLNTHQDVIGAIKRHPENGYLEDLISRPWLRDTPNILTQISYARVVLDRLDEKLRMPLEKLMRDSKFTRSEVYGQTLTLHSTIPGETSFAIEISTSSPNNLVEVIFNGGPDSEKSKVLGELRKWATVAPYPLRQTRDTATVFTFNTPEEMETLNKLLNDMLHSQKVTPK